ncbi:hypothetical protein GH741_07225 [Aquibacillus halophilus]|uniref:Uncharacterized protein n=1 Tax=Aquibacillus halophilus TaxID=930132 RepID=A0A6A8DA90_9BACI|nr:hypothetical protein [Aquibacillus halophilus]
MAFLFLPFLIIRRKIA